MGVFLCSYVLSLILTFGSGSSQIGKLWQLTCRKNMLFLLKSSNRTLRFPRTRPPPPHALPHATPKDCQGVGDPSVPSFSRDRSTYKSQEGLGYHGIRNSPQGHRSPSSGIHSSCQHGLVWMIVARGHGATAPCGLSLRLTLREAPLLGHGRLHTKSPCASRLRKRRPDGGACSRLTGHDQA